MPCLVTVTEGPERDRYNNPILVRTEAPVPGCRFRPLTAREKPISVLSYGLVGPPRVFDDMGGRPHKITVIVQRQTA